MIAVRLPFAVPELRAHTGDCLSFNPETGRFVVCRSVGAEDAGWLVAWALLAQTVVPPMAADRFNTRPN